MKTTAKEIKTFFESLDNKPRLETYYADSSPYKKLNTFSVLAEKINGFIEIVTSPGLEVIVNDNFISIEGHFRETTQMYKIGRNPIIDQFVTSQIYKA